MDFNIFEVEVIGINCEIEIDGSHVLFVVFIISAGFFLGAFWLVQIEGILADFILANEIIAGTLSQLFVSRDG